MGVEPAAYEEFDIFAWLESRKQANQKAAKPINLAPTPQLKKISVDGVVNIAFSELIDYTKSNEIVLIPLEDGSSRQRRLASKRGYQEITKEEAFKRELV